MVVPVMTGVNTIMREYPNGETTHLTVMVDLPLYFQTPVIT